MFEEADNLADIFRGGLTYYLLLTLPILIICSSNQVLASSEFNVQRMSQYDLNGVSYGCRASALSLEAKSLYTWKTSRHCVVAKFQDLTVDHFREIRQKAGGLVLLLPENISNITEEEKQHLYFLEQAMLDQASTIPIYFSTYNADLEKIVADITVTSDANFKDNQGQIKRESALSELINSISANGYQIVVTGGSHSPNKASKIAIFQGELVPMKSVKLLDSSGSNVDGNNKPPQIIITAHLNTFGIYNEYPLNADVAVFMTIAELFSKLYNSVNAAPKYRLLFLLTESGAVLNFQGAKKWLDENVQLQNVDFVLCLDTITQALNSQSDSLYMHVSKPPKEASAMNNFYKILKNVGGKYDNITIDGVHKKINLADTQLAWEHERFSMKRLPSFTLSSIKSPKDPVRNTIFRDSENYILRQTLKNAKIIAEALARYVYQIDEGEIFSGAMEITKNMIKSHLNLKSSQHNNDLKNAFEKYLKNVKTMYEKPDLREPDFMLYDGKEAILNVYRVKPAVFDLFLTFLISAYLTTIYFVIQYFSSFYSIVCKMTKPSMSNGGFQHSSKVKSN